MKIDEVLKVDVSRDIKERLESIYGISGESVERTLDCVADEVEPIIKDLKESYDADYDELFQKWDQLTADIDMLAQGYDDKPKEDILKEIDRIWRTF